MDKEKPAELMVEEIKVTEPELMIAKGESITSIHLSLPYDNFITASLSYSSAEIEQFSVHPELRNKGIGERLMRQMVKELKDRGARILRGTLQSPEALTVRSKVFGESNLNLHPDKRKFQNLFDCYKIKLTPEVARTNLDKGEYVECDVDLAQFEI
jgi:hypothetical protein